MSERRITKEEYKVEGRKRMIIRKIARIKKYKSSSIKKKEDICPCCGRSNYDY